MKDALLPKFTEFQVVTITDEITGKTIPVVYALDHRGWLWRKMAGQAWLNITGRDFFKLHEGDIP